MSREAIEVGAFTWSRVQRLYELDATTHWQRCESEGLQCPQEVFTQLFHEQSNNEDFAVIVRSIDYSALRASPFATAQGRPFGRSPARRAVVGSHAIYAAVLQGRSNGIERIPRPRFREASRARTPGSSSPGECTTHERPTRRRMAGLELLIGYTGLGNLLVLLDREEVPEIQKHLIWVGRAARALPREINDAPILERAFLTSEELK